MKSPALAISTLLIFCTTAFASDTPQRFRDSTLAIRILTEHAKPGDEIVVAVDYTLASSDAGDGITKVILNPLGPWVDNPDGKYTTTRQHFDYSSLHAQVRDVTPGSGTLTFTFHLGDSFRYNSLMWLANFIAPDGKHWPWHVRSSGPVIARKIDTFDIVVHRGGGLFKYGETPEIHIVWERPPASPKEKRTVAFTATNYKGETVATFEREVATLQEASTIAPLTKLVQQRAPLLIEATRTGEGSFVWSTTVPLPELAQKRGTFLIKATLMDEGASVLTPSHPNVLPPPLEAGQKTAGQQNNRTEAATRVAFLAIIPDNAKILGTKHTPFGATNISGESHSRTIRDLGASTIRQFVSWNEIEPAPDDYRLDKLQETIAANNAAALSPWICLYNPPAWAMRGDAYQVDYAPFLFDEAAFERLATRLAEEFKGKIWGFEWLNEIVPGNATPTPVETYLRFCEIGTRAVKAVDPAFKIQMAGGLWPRNYRTDLLAAGIAAYVDALPIHYGNRDGILEAAADAAKVAAPLEIWDNETAAGISVWNMPPRKAMTASLSQSEWIMRQWPGQLAAGATSLTYFGGWPDAAGNWSLFLDEYTPRPGAATYAVLASKLGLARPLGTAAYQGAVWHIFETPEGKGLAVVSAPAETPVRINAGTDMLVITDYQGNETVIKTDDGVATFAATETPVFVEGFDLASLAILCGASIGTANEAEPLPQITAIAGTEPTVTVKLFNPLREEIEVSFELVPYTLATRSATLSPDETKFLDISLRSAEYREFELLLKWKVPETINFDLVNSPENRPSSVPRRLTMRKPFRVTTIDPATLGNLIKNGGFENEEPKWSDEAKRVTLQGDGPGFEGHALEFTAAEGWQSAGQAVQLPLRGQTYLYTAWVWCDDMEAGSNIIVTDDKGKSHMNYALNVFHAGRNTRGFWRYLAHRRKTAPDEVAITFNPVANGSGFARFDNLRFTLWQGTDFAAEATHAATPPRIDGDLSEWDFTDNPIPLLCENQITSRDGYQWTPHNLAGVAKFKWDKDALYFAAQIRDDVHHPAPTGGDPLKGDALIIAFHPADRAADAADRAFQWILSATTPDGGSGVHTLLRPTDRSGGLRSGQLARDSSVYEFAVKRNGDITTYELKIPWSETGGFRPELGTRAGLSLQVIDYNGGASSGLATWGGGLLPYWAPQLFGVLTLVP